MKKIDPFERLVSRIEAGELKPRKPMTIARRLVEYHGKNVSDKELMDIAIRLHFEASIFRAYYQAQVRELS